MNPAAPPDEKTLEELIEHNPEIVAEEDGELLLVRRQKGIPDTEGGSKRWALDLLFVTREAVPVLIEVKQASNSELRRQVVGQLLDYAANGTAHWPPGEIQRVFEAKYDNSEGESDTVLERFLDGGNPEAFWQRVDENLAAGKVRLVVAADAIPAELARIVEFLNDQMRPAEVRAVELRWFESKEGRRTLVPRIVGLTERAHAEKADAKPKITPEQWIAEHYGEHPDTAAGIRWHLQVMERLGLDSIVTRRHFNIASGVPGRWPILVYYKNHGIGVFFGRDKQLRDDLLDAFGELDADNQESVRFRASRLTDEETRSRYQVAMGDFGARIGLV